jgi:proteasome lid subunit RPN8/RPN11
MYPTSISIQRDQWQAMLTHVSDSLPEEACGLLSGKGERVSKVLTVDNIDRSPYHFTMDPHQQVEALLSIEENDEELIGIYHSHPLGPASVSQRDVKQAAYPEAAILIWFKLENEWHCRAFAMLPDGPREIPILIEG